MTRPATPDARPPHALQTLFNLRREEIGPVLIAALFFFCVLTALMLLRPARGAARQHRHVDAGRVVDALRCDLAAGSGRRLLRA
ncbi:hypothetical protein [Halotalea alkalilenta]|uniref:hypothetical protein n=1 Tax=Halotalea alkalilenta TaxID=376489 RepID=UPI0004824409|nr:hypothetical protein [Halotalea alkalilenta]